MKEKEALSFEDRWAEAKAWYEDRVAAVVVPKLERWIATANERAEAARQRLTRTRELQ